MSVPITFLRSLLFNLIFYVGGIPLVIGAALSVPFGQEAVIAASRLWSQYHQLCVRWLLGIRTVVEGAFPKGAVIIAIKHEAMLETIEILRLIDRPAVVFKAELLNIPVWGATAQRHGVIPVARETGSAALRRMLKAAREAVTANRPIVIFPEGTRVAPGEQPPLRAGIAGLYKTLGLPIVPVAVNSGHLWPRHSFMKRSGIVTMRIGEPIPPGLGREEVEARLHTAINALNQ
ncbi:1-acyl-sn-glycerol-3-phosphate acyltransferase [Sphingomonas sp.]|uniref:lysophospholipid acyltransferase family protein n=1 Tax=Sphingomonas sp. TaxID=28214 RepID=UPI0025D1FDA2|nr:lysophospholipid acyltransferase family protein [Sphingomonas sp.]